MVFSSLPFLFLFLPLCLVLYFLMPNLKLKNAVLLVMSLVFYSTGEPVYVLLMLLCALVGWASGLLLEKYRESCISLGREVEAIGASETVRGIADNVDENGRLVIRTKNGSVRVNSGEVKLRTPKGYI